MKILNEYLTKTKHLLCVPLLLFAITTHANENLFNVDITSDDEVTLTDKTQIEVGDKINDSKIEQRLNHVYQNIESLQDITAAVDAGVVTLSGKVYTSEAYEKALNLASRTEGVIGTNDNIVQENDLSKRLGSINDRFLSFLSKLYENLPIYLLAIAVFIGFWLLAAFVGRCDFLFSRFTKNTFLKTLTKQIARGFLIIVGFVIALEILDATALLGTILGAAGILGLAIGFAIRDTVENYIASILLSIRQPFQPNDHIVLEGFEGKVIRLTSRDTILMTLDGNHVRIPNATVYKGNILNYSRNSTRRFSFEVGIDTEVEITAAQKVAIDTLLNTAGVIESPPPKCQVKLLGDSNVMLIISGWTDQNDYDFNKVRSEAIRAIKQAYDEAGFEMPEPIYRLKVQGAGLNFDGTRSDAKKPDSAKITRVKVTTSQALNVPADISKDTHIDEQIIKENTQETEDNLLSD